MNQENDRQNQPDIDSQVSEHFDALSDETTPAHLDRAVMREAKRAIRADNRSGSYGAWFRPVAFMAMVGLSLAIVLDLGRLGVLETGSDPEPESMPAVPALSPADRAVETARRDRSQAALSELKRQEKSPAGQPQAGDVPAMNDDVAGAVSPPATAVDTARPEPARQSKLQSAPAAESNEAMSEPPEDAVANDAFSAESRNALERHKIMDVSQDAASPAQPAATAPFAPPRAGDQVMSLLSRSECGEEQRASAEEWWTCVKALREAGLTEAADLEFENLKREFPDFAPPE